MRPNRSAADPTERARSGSRELPGSGSDRGSRGGFHRAKACPRQTARAMCWKINVGRRTPAASVSGSACALASVPALQRLRFSFEIFGGAQPRIPDRGVFCPLGKLAVPTGEIAQPLCLVHVKTVLLDGFQQANRAAKRSFRLTRF